MHDSIRKRLIPTCLAVLMFAFAVAAALAPATGLVAADASCPYGNCAPAPTPFWQSTAGYATLLGIVAAVVIAAIVALLLLQRRRGGGATRDSEPPSGEGTSYEEPPPESPGAEEPGAAEPEPSLEEQLDELDKLTRE